MVGKHGNYVYAPGPKSYFRKFQVHNPLIFHNNALQSIVNKRDILENEGKLPISWDKCSGVNKGAIGVIYPPLIILGVITPTP